MRHLFTTLRFRLILLVFLAVLPALAVILNSGLEQRRLAAEAAQKDVLNIVHHASLYQERVIEGVKHMLSTLAELPEVRQQNGTVASAIFARVLTKQEIYGNISAVDLQGKVFASARPQPGPASSDTGRSHFERALKTRGFAIGEFGIGRTTGKPTLHFAYPVLDHGVVQGVVSASLILDYLNTLAANTRLPAGGILTVIDRDGTILARYPEEQWVGKRRPGAEIIKIVLARGEGVAEAAGIDGVRCLFAFTPLGSGSHDLLVYAGVPLKTVYSEANRVLTRNVLALGGAGLLALMAAWMLGQFFLINPTRTLVNTAARLAGGDLSVRAHLSYDNGEFGQLAQSFDEMAAALEQRQTHLRDSEEKYRTLAENVDLGITLISSDYKIIMTNAGQGKIFGKPPRDFVGKYCFQEFEKRGEVCPHCPGAKTMATGEPMEVDTIGVHDDGTFHYARVRTFPTYDSLGKVTGFVEVVEDTTASRLAAAALEEERRLKEAILNNIPDIAWLKDKEGKFLSVNEPFATAAGVSLQEMVGKNDLDIWPPDLAKKYRADDLEVMRTKNRKCFEEPLTDSEQRTMWIETVKTPILDENQEVIGTTGIARDITPRRQMEEILRESETKYRFLAENSRDLIWRMDLNLHITYASPAVQLLTGFTPEEFLTLGLDQILTPASFQVAQENIVRLMEIELLEKPPLPPSATLEVEQRRKDGSTIWIEVQATLTRGPQGEITGLMGVSRDSTERRKARHALEQANEQLQTLVQQAEAWSRQMALFNEMSDVLQSCQTSKEAFEAIGHFVPKFFPTDAGALYLLGNSKNLLSPVVAWGQPPPAKESFAPDDCWAMRGGRAHRVDDPASALLCKHVSASDDPATGYLCIPLAAQGESLGILHVRFFGGATQGREAEDSETKQRLAVAIAENLALALANLKLRETLQNQAIRDPHTGLYNRRYLEETLDRELHRSRRLEAPLGVVMLDLDHFKDFNDTCGPAAGDALLIALAHTITGEISTEDIACRYGGEEFLLVMPGASLETTRERAELLRQAVQALQVKYQDRFLKAPTISLGVASFPDHGVTAEELVNAADAALYRAKKTGRDRVEIARVNTPAAAAS
jgi:diguanylate cyclase (GGDEF)-like protein/PAS domain S-box-containing protein